MRQLPQTAYIIVGHAVGHQASHIPQETVALIYALYHNTM